MQAHPNAWSQAMSLMTQTMPRGARDSAKADTGTLGSAHVAMIKRFAKSVAMIGGFVVVIVAVMSIKYVAFFPRFVH
jgi:hypothetical protein